ncbi:MAG: hypothetical protein LUQ07_01830 [Methanospirillum sp.]|nr:hypothetical protein [Methanospirillum sp.]
MKASSLVVLLLLATTTVFIIPAGAEEYPLSVDDKAFLSDLVTEGIPLLYQIPEAMNTGVFHGKDTAIADIAAEKKQLLAIFTDKISAYRLSSKTSALRDSWMAAEETLKKDLEEYGTLNAECGSCISTMKSMYPVLVESAGKVTKDLISFCVKNQVTL